MSKIVQWKRGNANVSSTYTGADGEITINTDTYALYVHDGETEGGHLVGGNTGNVTLSNITINKESGNTSIITQDGTNLKIIASGVTSPTIYMWTDVNRMGFNTVSNAFDFNFNGELSATDYIASKSAQRGYSFYTPGEGYSGFNHVNGPPSYIQITHDDTSYIKFISNYTSQMTGNLVISSEANVFGSFPNAFVQVYSNVSSYSQMVHQNLDGSELSSADFVLTSNDGTDSTFFVDLGIASNSYNYPGYGVIKPHDAYLLAVGESIEGPGSSGSGNLILGSTTGAIKFVSGASEDENLIASVTTDGFIPGANVTYSLGTSEFQWRDLWVSNNTIYINSIPLTLDDNNNLVVNGSPVTANTGTIEFNGSMISVNPDSTDEYINISPSGAEGLSYIQVPVDDVARTTDLRIHNDVGNIELYSNSSTWKFDKHGDIVMPSGSHNIKFGNALINYQNDYVGIYSGNTNPNNIYTITDQGSGYWETITEFDQTGGDHNYSMLWSGFYDSNVSQPRTMIQNTVGSNSYNWVFDETGNITLPTDTSSINYANGAPYGGSAGGDSTFNSITLTALPYVGNPLIGEPLTFVHTNYGDEIDYIDTDVAITRGTNNGIYNPEVEGGWNQSVSPENTVWNADGWGDLADVKYRSYVNFYNAVGGRLGANIINKELVMYDTVNDRYYAIKFLSWTLGGNGGGFSYTRQEIDAELILDFVHTDNGSEVDTISPDVSITRGTEQGIYNPDVEGGWDNNVSPANTLWNSDGWDNLSNIANRNYVPFFQASNGQLGLNVIGKYYVMYDMIANEYYTVKFHSWTQGGNGGGFSYTRRLIDKTVTGLGVTFADGTTQTTAYVPGQESTYTWTNPQGSTWHSNEYHSGGNIVIAANTTVKWFDADLAYNGGANFTGAIINYQARSTLQSGVITGQIMIANDWGNYNVTHTEVTSGPTSIGTLSLWETDPNTDSEKTLWAKRLDGLADNVWVQYTARMFYGPYSD